MNWKFECKILTGFSSEFVTPLTQVKSDHLTTDGTARLMQILY